jgi:hypothetical protein
MPVRLWSKEETAAHVAASRETARRLNENMQRLRESPDINKPEVRAKLQDIVDKHKAWLKDFKEKRPPAAGPQSQPAASSAASKPEGEGEGGFLGWLSGLWRGWTDDGPAAEQQDEPQHAEGQ